MAIKPSKMSPLQVAWGLLILGSFSFSNSVDSATALSGHLSVMNLMRAGCVLAAGIILVPVAAKQFRLQVTPLAMFFFYVLICGLSSAWSVSYIVSFGKFVELGLAVLIVLLASQPNSQFTAKDLLKTTVLLSACILLAILAGYLIGANGFSTPTRGVLSVRMETWFLSSNSVGYMSALCGCYFAALGSTQGGVKKKMAWVIYIFMFCVAVLAYSRTGILEFVIGTCFVLFFARKYEQLAILILFLALVLTISSGFLLDFLDRGQSQQELYDLSGRMGLWDIASRSVINNPIFGIGYGVSRSLFILNLDVSKYSDNISSLHNSVFEVLVGVGALGLLPWGGAYAWALVKAFKPKLYVADIAACTMIFLSGITAFMSSTIGGWFNIPIAFYICALGVISQRKTDWTPRKTA